MPACHKPGSSDDRYHNMLFMCKNFILDPYWMNGRTDQHNTIHISRSDIHSQISTELD